MAWVKIAEERLEEGGRCLAPSRRGLISWLRPFDLCGLRLRRIETNRFAVGAREPPVLGSSPDHSDFPPSRGKEWWAGEDSNL